MPSSDDRALATTATTTSTTTSAPSATDPCWQMAEKKTAGVPSDALGAAFRAEYNACKSGRAAPPISYR